MGSAIDLDPQAVLIHQEHFNATNNQEVFSLTKGAYRVGTNSVSWYLDGIKQSNEAIEELSSISIKIRGGVPESSVIIEYLEFANVAIGLKGEMGPQGKQGIQGEGGLQGPQGIQGLKGSTGDKGDTGLTGKDGAKGDAGPRGLQGDIGPRGLTGEKGDKGDPFIYSDFTALQIANLKGAKGDTGNTGLTGQKGDTGLRGIQGIQGPKGDIGLTGLKGDKGDKGDQGIQGVPGAAVADSVEWTKVLNRPTSMPANGGNADTVGGVPADGLKPPNNILRNNLGSPSVTEMALIDSQAANKIWFHDPNKILIEESDDDITFVERTNVSETVKKRLVAGTNKANFPIPKGKYTRITIEPQSYVYLNWLYLYISTNGNALSIKIERRVHGTGAWTVHCNYTNKRAAWPGHFWLPHLAIPFSLTNHNDKVRITIDADMATNTSTTMTLYGIEWWGGYPAGRRTIYSHDENRKVYFPDSIRASTFENSSGIEVSYTDTIINGKTGVITKNDIVALGIPATDTVGPKIITSITEPILSTGDQWHKEI